MTEPTTPPAGPAFSDHVVFVDERPIDVLTNLLANVLVFIAKHACQNQSGRRVHRGLQPFRPLPEFGVHGSLAVEARNENLEDLRVYGGRFVSTRLRS